MRIVQSAFDGDAAIAAVEDEVCTMADDAVVAVACLHDPLLVWGCQDRAAPKTRQKELGDFWQSDAAREAASLHRQALAHARADGRRRAVARRRVSGHQDFALGPEAFEAAALEEAHDQPAQLEEDDVEEDGEEEASFSDTADLDCRVDSRGVFLRRQFPDDPEGRLEELIRLADLISESECAEIARYYGCQEALGDWDGHTCWEPLDIQLCRSRKTQEVVSLRSARLKDRVEHCPKLTERLRLPKAPSRWELLISRLLRREGCWTRPTSSDGGRRCFELPVRSVLRARERTVREGEKPKGKGAAARLRKHVEAHKRCEDRKKAATRKELGLRLASSLDRQETQSECGFSRAAKALSNVRKSARKLHQEALPLLRERVLKLGFTAEHLTTALDWIANTAPIIVQVALDEMGDKLAADTHYRNQFETHTSHGNLNNLTRSQWEDNLFNKAYAGASPFQRCKYGVLNVTNDDHGVVPARQYGWSYLQLKGVRRRTTCTAQDSGGCRMEAVGTLDAYAHVLNRYTDDNLKQVVEVGSGQVQSHSSGTTRPYKEVQIHGAICLSEDVERIVVHGGKNSEEKDGAMLERLSEACGGAPVEWIRG